MAQWLGNPVQAALGGRLDVIAEMFNPKTIASTRRAVLEANASHPRPWEVDPMISTTQRMHARLGSQQGRDIRGTYHVGVGTGLSVKGDLIGQQALRKIPGVGNFMAGLVGSKRYKLWGAYGDATYREAIDYRTTLRVMREQTIPDYQNQTIGRLIDWGVDRAEAE